MKGHQFKRIEEIKTTVAAGCRFSKKIFTKDITDLK